MEAFEKHAPPAFEMGSDLRACNYRQHLRWESETPLSDRSGPWFLVLTGQGAPLP